jgi:CBS domain-containing protein
LTLIRELAYYSKRRVFTGMLVRHIMIKKVVTARKSTTVKSAIKTLFKRHVGSIVVLNDEKKCVGIFTERDAIRVVAQNVSLDKPLEEVMTKNVIVVQEDASFQEARRIILTHEIRHLPVVNSTGQLVGLIAVRNILNEFFKM